MKYRLLSWLACPACRSESLALETKKTETQPVYVGQFEPGEDDVPGVDLKRGEEQVILEGALHCKDCGAIYAIREGIPRMLPAGYEAGPASAHRWTSFDTGQPEWEQNFLDLAAPLKPADFLGKLVLDAGCGFGRHSFFASRFGAEVVAIDASGEAVASCARNTATQSRVHIVQGDLNHPPFREEVFDLALCFGVLHHMDRPDQALEAITGLIRPGGRLSVWVYGPRQGATLALSNGLRGFTTSLEPEELYRVSQGIASGLRVFSHTPYRVLGKVPGIGAVVSHLPVHDHHKWPFPVVVADIYDRLRVPVKHWFTGQELEVWYAEKGFADVTVTRKVGNSESFRATGVRR